MIMDFSPGSVLLLVACLHGLSDAASLIPVATDNPESMRSDGHEKFHWSNDTKDQLWGPISAFQRQEPSNRSLPWLGMPKAQFPQRVFYEFDEPKSVEKFGFRNRREDGLSLNNPIDFDLIGSNDCINWSTIHSVEGCVWRINDEEQTWEVGNATKDFRCYGISVNTISGRNYAAIQDIKFWQRPKVVVVEVSFDNPDKIGTSGEGIFVHTQTGWDNDWSAERAFKRQEDKFRPWMSRRSGGVMFPTSVYYQFDQPTTIVKFGFRNRREPGAVANNPVDFDLVGSDDCNSLKLSAAALKVVTNEAWSGNDVEKSWTVSEDNQKAFFCYGIRVNRISGNNAAAIQNIRMWKIVGQK